MISWISQNSDWLQVVLNASIVIVWLVYLQVFLSGFRRQRRSDILITLGAGAGLKARCFVANLGLEPISILDVIVDVCTDRGTERAVITDRSELTDEEVTNPREATNQGPLTSGRFFDIGTFEELIARASEGGEFPSPSSLRWVQGTVIAATSAESSIAGACRKYAVRSEDGSPSLYPTTIIAEQIRSRSGRRDAIKQLSARLVDAD